MTVVVDASVMVALLVDVGRDGANAEAAVVGQRLAAPHLMPAEVANVLRRSTTSRLISADTAALALADLGDLPVLLYPFGSFSDRVWELRRNLTSYDAWYVALAEELDVPLLTLDRRLRRAPGLRCEVRVP